MGRYGACEDCKHGTGQELPSDSFPRASEVQGLASWTLSSARMRALRDLKNDVADLSSRIDASMRMHDVVE